MNQIQSPYSHLFQDTKNFKTSDDLSLRYVSLKTDAPKTRGSFLLLNGWTEFIEKYGEPISTILEKGFDVYALDWRGQGGSSRSLPNREKGYVKDFDEFTGDLNEFVEKVMTPTAVMPRILMAHSMGGNISIQYLHDYPGAFEKAIFCRPMFDLPAGPLMKTAFTLLSTLAKTLGFGSKYIPGRGDWAEIPFKENRVTSDPTRYAHDLALLHNHPQLRLGSPTYAWLAATLKANKRVNAQTFLNTISIPTMVFSGTADKVVSIPSQKFVAQNLPQSELISIPDGSHELLRETDSIQETLWENFDRFLSDI